MPKQSLWAVLRGTFKEFKDDELIDRAAFLTYYGILSLFPALLVLVSVLGMTGQSTTRQVLDNVQQLTPGRREHTRLWCGAAVLMSFAGGRRGRKAAVAGLASMAVAELVSNAVAKPLRGRPRPPKEWIPHDDVDDRPASSSFPSGHTAAAVAFTSAVAPTWPRGATACAVPAVMVAAERVHSGAHYPTDVAVGAVIGLAATALVRAAPRPLLQHPR
ncbi:YhjD/YihY/BrkB family envelope integrity protein [Streptomyces olindensis]|uniref:YhjD/YihY/BrkB family envelope integrity protein n=2 Tax=Streptomyces olindensis TaxID=358823 RepID=A0ABV2XQA2_9ACTN